jgi:cytochrome c oxidase assembly protein Cox11/cytochrome c2
MGPARLRTIALVGGLLCLVAGMTVAVSYSVTLYRLFCSVTGAGGTTQRVAADTAAPSAREVTVFFSTNVAPNLPWRFVPVQNAVRTHLGQDTLVFFRAENRSDHDIVGHATFNVTPDKSGIYFKKIQCFCFTEERLAAHQSVQMPVDFFVDPALASDPATAEVDQITLSYTFFRSLQPQGAADLARFSAAPAGQPGAASPAVDTPAGDGPGTAHPAGDSLAGDPAAGERAFAGQCAACHALDANRVGPALDHVVGRTAGTRPGYRYSAALARSAIVWSQPALEQWLAGPRAFIPGAVMPMAVADPAIRRDIVAYLARQSGATPVTPPAATPPTATPPAATAPDATPPAATPPADPQPADLQHAATPPAETPAGVTQAAGTPASGSVSPRPDRS